jgi:ABC-2 type transport system ATP-binding protein
MKTLLEATNLWKSFGPRQAVRGVSFSLKEGEVLAFVGPNGAGKTTTMRLLTGFLTPDAGSVTVGGYSPHGRGGRKALRKIGYLPEGAPLYNEMTVGSFLNFIARVRGLRGADADAAFKDVVQQTELHRVLSQRIETLSTGFRRRVGLAQALLHAPEVLLLDEPTDGLDPNQKHHVRTLIKQLGQERAVLISTHNLDEIEAMCTRVLLLNAGEVVFDGSPKSMEERGIGRVKMEVPTPEAPALAEALKALPDVAEVTLSLIQSDPTRWLTIIPTHPTSLLRPVTGVLAERRVRAIQLIEEPARLENVFRTLTTGTDFSHRPHRKDGPRYAV